MPPGSPGAAFGNKNRMKMTKTKKLIALALSVVMIAAFLTGCSIFEYNEDSDMEQPILEISSFTYEYEVPVIEDYEDIYGNKVYEVNTDPDSDGYGQTTDEVVSVVKRDHNGDPIHVPLTNESNEFMYVVFNKNDDGSTDYTKSNNTTSGSAAYKEADGKNNDNHYIVYAENPDYDEENDPIGRKYIATEYRFDGVIGRTVNASTAYYAVWVSVDDDTTAYGDVSVNGDPVSDSSQIAGHMADFPVVSYTRTGDNFNTDKDVWAWEEPMRAYETATGTTEPEAFYKDTLIEYFDNNGYSLFNDSGYTIDEVFDEFIKQFYTTYLTYAEADIAIAGGYVEWGVPERNEVEQSVYDQIDTALEQLYAEVADDFGISYPDITEGSDSTDTTYPTPPTEDPSDDSMEDYKVWNITQDPGRCIGNSPDASVNSLKRAGLRKFVDVIENNIEDERAISAEERQTFESEIATMRDMIKTAEGTDKLYTILSTFDVIWFMYGESQEYSIKTTGLRDYLVSDITSSESSAREAFAEELARQKAAYTEDISTYYSEATGDTTILYFADEEIFWVKHILIPFSDDQTAALEAYKNAGHSDAEVEAYRRELGMTVEVYKHVDGEEDTSRSYTIQQAWADIKSTMESASGSAKEAALAFDELIYTYNTDEGIFDNETGYAVTATPELLGGQEESYMIEFATESRALYNAYRRGMSLDEFKNSDPNDDYETDEAFSAPSGKVDVGSISIPVLTDYGWHIMFLNVAPKAGTSLSFESYLTAAEITTAGDAFVEDVSTNRDNYYENWSATMANRYFTGAKQPDRTTNGSVITVYKNRFGSYLDDYEASFTAQAEAEAEQEAAEQEQESSSGTTA